MKRKLISLLLILCLSAGLLAGCVQYPIGHLSDYSALPAATAAETEPTETEPPVTEPPATEPPVTEPPMTERPVTEPPARPQTADACFNKVEDKTCDHFSNQTIEILFRVRSVVRRDLSTGTEEILFTLPQNDAIDISLIGVTENRLYFGWNEVEDWWGVDVYSLDYRGSDRKEHGQYWAPHFENGWLVLLGFRSDVSPTEMLLIDRNDRVIVSESRDTVWDAAVSGKSVYYIYIEGYDDSYTYGEREGEWNYDLIRVDPDGSQSLVTVFTGRRSPYTSAHIYKGVICFGETGEYYDLITLAPTSQPTYP